MEDLKEQTLYKTFAKLPKAELHVHLRGAITTDCLQKLVDQADFKSIWMSVSSYFQNLFLDSHLQPVVHSLLDGDKQKVNAIFAYSDFVDFLKSSLFSCLFIRDIADFQLLLKTTLDSFKDQNIVYAEITVSVPEYLLNGIALEDIVAALDEAKKQAETEVWFIVDLVRNFGPEDNLRVLKEIQQLKPRSVIGITLGGNEKEYPPELFQEVYKQAKLTDWGLTVHAGEFLGAESVKTAVFDLSVKRLGHGVRVVEDLELLKRVVEKKVPFEVSLSSNLFLGIYPNLKEHPIKQLVNHGALVTLSTDDPTFFKTTLAKEYTLGLKAGLTLNQLSDIACESFRQSKLDTAVIENYCRKIRQILEGIEA